MRSILVLCLAATLAGCAAQVTHSNPRSVVISAGKPPIKTGEAQAIADKECAKHSRFARIAARPIYGESSDYVFDCVE